MLPKKMYTGFREGGKNTCLLPLQNDKKHSFGEITDLRERSFLTQPVLD